MKKFLLSLIALAGIATSYAAETVTFDFANKEYGLTRESDAKAKYIDNGTKLTVTDGVEITLTKKDGSNGWRLWKDGLRAYKNSDAGMTISATGHKITKVTITQKSGVITAINGTSESGTEISYPTSGEATVTLAFTVSDNGAISALAVELDGEVGVEPEPDPEPDPIETVGKGTEDDPYTVADVIALNNTKPDKAWVTGYIVGALASNPYKAETKAPFTVNTNIYIAATATETDTTKMVPVALPTAGTIRSDLNLQDRPGNLGKEVSVYGTLEKYFSVPGVKNTSDYTIVGGIAPVTVTETASLTSFIDEQSESNMKITGTVTVFYQSPDKKYTFITDGESNLEIFGALPEYHNGDQLTGIVGKYGFYNKMPQMTPQVDSFGEATAGTPVEPTEVAFNQINIAQYVKVIAIEIYSEEVNGKTNYYFGEGDAKRQIFDRFNLFGDDGLKDGICTITGIGAIFNDNVQIFPTELEYKMTSISEISTDAAANEIFDLQGRKVSKAAHGMYIINGKKTIVR